MKEKNKNYSAVQSVRIMGTVNSSYFFISILHRRQGLFKKNLSCTGATMLCPNASMTLNSARPVTPMTMDDRETPSKWKGETR